MKTVYVGMSADYLQIEHVNTINLPRIAYDAAGDDDRLFELLRERMELTIPVFKL